MAEGTTERKYHCWFSQRIINIQPRHSAHIYVARTIVHFSTNYIKLSSDKLLSNLSITYQHGEDKALIFFNYLKHRENTMKEKSFIDLS